eukprot:4668761-Prymnesium_polylepis.1
MLASRRRHERASTREYGCLVRPSPERSDSTVLEPPHGALLHAETEEVELLDHFVSLCFATRPSDTIGLLHPATHHLDCRLRRVFHTACRQLVWCAAAHAAQSDVVLHFYQQARLFVK